MPEERKKLPRLQRYGEPYTTGDSQEWTYEHTWEGYVEYESRDRLQCFYHI